MQNQSKEHAILLTVEVEAKGEIRIDNTQVKAFFKEDLPTLILSKESSQQLGYYLQISQQPQEKAIYRFGNSSIRRRRYLFITWLGVIFRYPVMGATIIARLPDGQIVLVKRPKKSDQKEAWGLPGGMVDWGEDIPTTVNRELKEETGLNLVKIQRIVGVYSEAFRDPRVHSIAVSVEVEAEGTFQVEARTFTVEELRSRLNNMALIHDHRRQLQDYFQGLTTIA